MGVYVCERVGVGVCEIFGKVCAWVCEGVGVFNVPGVIYVIIGIAWMYVWFAFRRNHSAPLKTWLCPLRTYIRIGK